MSSLFRPARQRPAAASAANASDSNDIPDAEADASSPAPAAAPASASSSASGTPSLGSVGLANLYGNELADSSGVVICPAFQRQLKSRHRLGSSEQLPWPAELRSTSCLSGWLPPVQSEKVNTTQAVTPGSSTDERSDDIDTPDANDHRATKARSLGVRHRLAHAYDNQAHRLAAAVRKYKAEPSTEQQADTISNQRYLVGHQPCSASANTDDTDLAQTASLPPPRHVTADVHVAAASTTKSIQPHSASRSRPRHARWPVRLWQRLRHNSRQSEPPLSPLPAPAPPPPPYWSHVHRVVIIGIHGWSLMGGLLGVKANIIANKLCSYAHQALFNYFTEACGCSPEYFHSEVEVTCIPLYGHGRVEQRVRHYMQQHMPRHQQKLLHADLVLVAAHSQGTMVSTQLVSELIQQQWLNPDTQNITLLHMAALNHGPYPDLPGDLLAATKELFTYTQPESELSKRHLVLGSELLRRGVKLLLVASTHDQVVPLYSSLWQGLAPHSHLLRAIYTDVTLYQPDFVHALLTLVLYLTNTHVAGDLLNANHTLAAAGDVLVHLSGFVRGRLLESNGGAHSAVHREIDVYQLAVEYAMTRHTVHPDHKQSNCDQRPLSNEPTLQCNSYALWASYLTDAFTYTAFNRHLLALRLNQLLQLLRTSDIPGVQSIVEIQLLTTLYQTWSPHYKPLRVMRDALATVFDSVDSSPRPLIKQSANDSAKPLEEEVLSEHDFEQYDAAPIQPQSSATSARSAISSGAEMPAAVSKL